MMSFFVMHKIMNDPKLVWLRADQELFDRIEKIGKKLKSMKFDFSRVGGCNKPTRSVLIRMLCEYAVAKLDSNEHLKEFVANPKK